MTVTVHWNIAGPEVGAPFVGGLSNGSLLTVSEVGPAKVVCHPNRSTNLFLLVGFILFGPVTGCMFYFNWDKVSEANIVVMTLVCLFLTYCDVMILVSLIRQPRIEVDKTTGTLTFQTTWSRTPHLTLRRDDIREIRVETRTYYGKHQRSYPNYILLLETREGVTWTLCCSTDQTAIDTFKTALESVTGLTATQVLNTTERGNIF